MQSNQSSRDGMDSASVEKLEEDLRAELAAVETYEQALKGVEHVEARRTLQEILGSHARRTAQLRDKINELGGTPPKSSGIWGAFAKAVQAGADLLGDRTAVAALEEGEDHLVKLYKEGLANLDPSVQQFISNEILPEEQRTHGLCRSMKGYMRRAS